VDFNSEFFEIFNLIYYYLFLDLHIKKSKNKKHCWNKTKKYIAVKRGHGGTQKMIKDWLRKFKNTEIKI
jgi:hypothetical protein